jgi:hypothetical protein
MIGSLLAAAVLGVGAAPAESVSTVYDPRRDDRPIATLPGPEINGRLWVSRPLIGPEPGPILPHFGPPGPDHYGAVDNPYAGVPVRVGHIVVTVSAWERIDKPGMQRFEDARQFWLRENNYTGGVRTFVNDLHLWIPPEPRAMRSDEDPGTAGGIPEPRATIRVPEGTPRQRRPLRVQGTAPEALVLLSEEPIRISWPMTAPVQTVAHIEP